MEEQHSHPSEDQIFFFERQEVALDDFESSGTILDIGGGGEGIIGILKGEQVVAIDPVRQELEGAADGPLKIVMDGRDLQFLDGTFGTATAFFSLMYIKSREDNERVLGEVYRVLKPGGQFLIWDVTVVERVAEDKDIYAVPLLVRVAGREIETGYAQRWPQEPHDLAYYVELAESTGFRAVGTEEHGCVFFLRLEKLHQPG